MSIRTFVSRSVDIVERSARQFHDLISRESAVARPSYTRDPLPNLSNPSAFLGVIHGNFLDDYFAILVADIELGRGRDPGAVADRFRNGDLALAGDPHGNT